MHSAGVPPQKDAAELSPAEEVIHRLSHDLRQPLSGIEASAYYIDMVVSQARPDLIPHCRRLRQMVRQAGWLLDDAAHCAAFRPALRRTFHLADICARLAAKLFAEEDAILDLHLPPSMPAAEAPETLPQLIGHLASFFRDAAACPDPIHLSLACDGRDAVITCWSEACEEPEPSVRLIATGQGRSFAERFAQAVGGSLHAEAASRRLLVSLRLPVLVEQRA